VAEPDNTSDPSSVQQVEENSQKPVLGGIDGPVKSAINVVETQANITAEKIIGELLEQEIYNEKQLIELLGAKRNKLNLTELERALARDSRVNSLTVAKLKSKISGYKHVDLTEVEPNNTLPKEVSQRLGAVALDLPEPSIAMVEDVPQSVELIREKLGSDFEIYACALAQFKELFSAAYKGQKTKFLPKIGDIYDVFDYAIDNRASDIHISVGAPPAVRIDGKIQYMQVQPPDLAWVRSECTRLAGEERMRIMLAENDLDLAFSYGSARFRVNMGSERHGITVAARQIPTSVPSMEDINLPDVIKRLVNLDRGLVLVTGPTGSGKSTTLASILAAIARILPKHIITLEDPIEFHLPQGRSVVHQRELGKSFSSFAGGLRQALRQDPDVVLVGEMRDIETIRTALTAAETGHLVFGTLHTYDASSTVARVVSAFPAEEQEQIRALLSHILKATVSQTLLPLATGSGRTAAFEVMLSNPAIQANLRKKDGQGQIRQTMETSHKQGMQTMDMALAGLLRSRVVTEADALEKAFNTEDVLKRAAS